MPTAQFKPVHKIIDVQTAASAAMNYFHKLYDKVSEVSLEEVELSEDEQYWLITLGFKIKKSLLEQKPYSFDDPLSLYPPKTKFKVFKVDAKTGRVVAMKIRAIG